MAPSRYRNSRVVSMPPGGLPAPIRQQRPGNVVEDVTKSANTTPSQPASVVGGYFAPGLERSTPADRRTSMPVVASSPSWGGARSLSPISSVQITPMSLATPPPSSRLATPRQLEKNPSETALLPVAQSPPRSVESDEPFPSPAPTKAEFSGSAQNFTGNNPTIVQIHKRDDADIWTGWKRHVFHYLAPVLTLLYVVSYTFYLSLRIACVVWAQRLQGQVFSQAWVFIAVETAIALPAMMHNLWTMFAMKRRRRSKLRILGDDVPGVDVFITCCGEEDRLVLDTVLGACEQDYPSDKFRVIVLDDAKSRSLQKGVAEIMLRYGNVYYMARTKYPGVPHHFKSGNLNYGLEEVKNLPGGAAEYMAALDADMIPEPIWLRSVVPHLVQDGKLALACPPQLFYNTPPSDPLHQSLDYFVHIIEPIKDAMGVAWCTGSGYVVRRAALDDIGNFPLGSLAEDVATSTLMLGRGWSTAYVHEPLQFGTVPEDFASHLKQRTRWAVGTVDTSVKLNFCLWGDKVRLMTPAQRFSGFLYAALNIFNILLTFSLFAIPIILIMGKPLVAYATTEQLRWLIWACFAGTMCQRASEFALFIPAGYHTGRRESRYAFWLSPYIALSLIKAFLVPKWMGGGSPSFKPTGSMKKDLNERDPTSKAGMVTRIWVILFNYMALFHFVFVYLTLAAVVTSIFRFFYSEDSIANTIVSLLTHAFWPPLIFVFICSALWTPIAYAIDPPTMPHREELLERDPKTGVAHPTERSKQIAFGGQSAWLEIEYTFTTVYTAIIFAASFVFLR